MSNYDQRCHDLACVFLEERDQNRAAELAQAIQDAIEDWLEANEFSQSEPAEDRCPAVDQLMGLGQCTYRRLHAGGCSFRKPEPVSQEPRCPNCKTPIVEPLPKSCSGCGANFFVKDEPAEGGKA